MGYIIISCIVACVGWYIWDKMFLRGKKIHFHKWVAADKVKSKGKLYNTVTGQTIREDVFVLNILEVCSCGKMKAYVKDVSGKIYNRDPDYMLDYLGLTKEQAIKKAQ